MARWLLFVLCSCWASPHACALILCYICDKGSTKGSPQRGARAAPITQALSLALFHAQISRRSSLVQALSSWWPQHHGHEYFIQYQFLSSCLVRSTMMMNGRLTNYGACVVLAWVSPASLRSCRPFRYIYLFCLNKTVTLAVYLPLFLRKEPQNARLLEHFMTSIKLYLP